MQIISRSSNAGSSSGQCSSGWGYLARISKTCSRPAAVRTGLSTIRLISRAVSPELMKHASVGDDEVRRCAVPGKPGRKFFFKKLGQRIVVIAGKLLTPKTIEQRGRFQSRSKKRREESEPIFDFSSKLIGGPLEGWVTGSRPIGIQTLQIRQLLPQRIEFVVGPACVFHFRVRFRRA